MSKASNPHRGSMQFWPRKRSKHSFVRIRSWAKSSKVKPLGFIGYKAGMTHVMALDNNPKSMTKDEKISIPVTIFDCPPMFVLGVSFYKKSLLSNKKIAFVMASELSKDVKKLAQKKVSLPKKETNKIENVTEFDELKLLVMSKPSNTTTGVKKPKFIEIALGGSKDDQLNFAKENLGKDISVNDVFTPGNFVDAHAVTKGKGFQGTVKRYGVSMMSHKAEKLKRGIANMGAWTPKRVDYRVAQPGKMGYHLRTEYNKQVLKIGDDTDSVNPGRGLHKYGLVKNNYLLIKGSVAGPRKAAVFLSDAIRADPRVHKDAPEITYISK
jgi:large subunit ribosomal protein L3